MRKQSLFLLLLALALATAKVKQPLKQPGGATQETAETIQTEVVKEVITETPSYVKTETSNVIKEDSNDNTPETSNKLIIETAKEVHGDIKNEIVAEVPRETVLDATQEGITETSSKVTTNSVSDKKEDAISKEVIVEVLKEDNTQAPEMMVIETIQQVPRDADSAVTGPSEPSKTPEQIIEEIPQENIKELITESSQQASSEIPKETIPEESQIIEEKLKTITVDIPQVVENNIEETRQEVLVEISKEDIVESPKEVNTDIIMTSNIEVTASTSETSQTDQVVDQVASESTDTTSKEVVMGGVSKEEIPEVSKETIQSEPVITTEQIVKEVPKVVEDNVEGARQEVIVKISEEDIVESPKEVNTNTIITSEVIEVTVNTSETPQTDQVVNQAVPESTNTIPKASGEVVIGGLKEEILEVSKETVQSEPLKTPEQIIKEISQENIKESSKELIAESSHQVSSEISKETIQEESQINEEKLKPITIDIPQVVENNIEETHQEVLVEIPKEDTITKTSEEVVIGGGLNPEVSKETVQEVSQEATIEITEEVSIETQKEINLQLSTEVPEETPLQVVEATTTSEVFEKTGTKALEDVMEPEEPVDPVSNSNISSEVPIVSSSQQDTQETTEENVEKVDGEASSEINKEAEIGYLKEETMESKEEKLMQTHEATVSTGASEETIPEETVKEVPQEEIGKIYEEIAAPEKVIEISDEKILETPTESSQEVSHKTVTDSPQEPVDNIILEELNEIIGESPKESSSEIINEIPIEVIEENIMETEVEVTTLIEETNEVPKEETYEETSKQIYPETPQENYNEVPVEVIEEIYSEPKEEKVRELIQEALHATETEVDYQDFNEIKTFLEQVTKKILNDRIFDDNTLWQYPNYQGLRYISEYYILLHYLGLEKQSAFNTATYKKIVLASQLENGSWELLHDPLVSDGHLDSTITTYWALKVMGEDVNSDHMKKAGEWILSHGGIEKSSVFTKCLLALLGQYDWENVLYLPLTLFRTDSIYSYTNINNFVAQWVYPNLVPISYLRYYKVHTVMGPKFSVQELFVEKPQFNLTSNLKPENEPEPGILNIIRIIMDLQEQNGAFGGYTVSSLLSIAVLKDFTSAYPDLISEQIDEAVKKAFDFLELSYLTLPGAEYKGMLNDGRFFENTLILLGLMESHVPIEKLSNTINYIMKNGQQANGGFCFGPGFESSPDTETTAFAVQAMLKSRARYESQIKKSMEWLISMQNDNGGFPAFHKDKHMNFLVSFITSNLAFSNSTELFDQSSVDLTARVLEACADYGYEYTEPFVQKAIEYIKKEQSRFGSSWEGRWITNHIPTTSSVLVSLRKLGYDMNEPWVKKAAKWLVSKQNEDGGWGETPLSYNDPELAGFGVSTPTQTAFALMGLIAVADKDNYSVSDEIFKGIVYLKNAYSKYGEWIDESPVGTAQRGISSIQYPSCAKSFPVMALSRFLDKFGEDKACSALNNYCIKEVIETIEPEEYL